MAPGRNHNDNSLCAQQNKDGQEMMVEHISESFVEYINEQTGLERKVGGGFSGEAGRIKGLDNLARTFMKATSK